MLVPKYSRSREMDSFRGNSCDYGREGTGEKFRVLHYLDSSGKKERFSALSCSSPKPAAAISPLLSPWSFWASAGM